jgi:hypothetical protein
MCSSGQENGVGMPFVILYNEHSNMPSYLRIAVRVAIITYLSRKRRAIVIHSEVNVGWMEENQSICAKCENIYAKA